MFMGVFFGSGTLRSVLLNGTRARTIFLTVFVIGMRRERTCRDPQSANGRSLDGLVYLVEL